MPQMLSAAQATVQLSSADIPDEVAVTMPNMYPNFMETLGQTFTLHQIIEHEGNLYRIGQPSITTSTVYIPGTTGTESRSEETGTRFGRNGTASAASINRTRSSTTRTTTTTSIFPRSRTTPGVLRTSSPRCGIAGTDKEVIFYGQCS